MGEVSNPDTRHFFMQDYFMYVSLAGSDPDYVVIKVIMNPFINILWFGAIMMVAGLGYAFLKRIRRKYTSNP
jgi:cytochrome c biogenesis factor